MIAFAVVTETVFAYPAWASSIDSINRLTARSSSLPDEDRVIFVAINRMVTCPPSTPRSIRASALADAKG
jgi:hypothetical protein